MSTLVFVDTNIPIYAAGRDHPLRGPCRELILLIGANPELFVTSAEVLQELLRRYLGAGRRPAARPVLDDFSTLMSDRVAAIYAADVETAAELADQHHTELSARDLLHLAVMRRLGCERIVTADTGFVDVANIARLDPANLAAWRQDLEPGTDDGQPGQ